MALRCLLVSMVACLGFDLPTARDLSSWTMTGRDWVSSRVVDLSALQAEASGWLSSNDPTMNRPVEAPAVASTEVSTPAPALTTEESSLTADLAFDSINEGMALSFADDLEATRTQQALAEPAVAASPVESTETIVAAEPAPAVEPAATPEVDSLALAFPAADAGSTEDEATETAPSQDERIASAVRLTREAVQAWAAVIQPVGDEPTATR